MYESHPCFEPPSDRGARIWRYLDLARLIFMLQTRSLHFTRVDRFEDRFEGALPKAYVEHLRQARERRRAEHPDEWKTLEALGQVKASATEEYKELRSRAAVHCWHQNEHESAAMWSQYAKNGSGVAIGSTYEKLINSFDPKDETVLIFVGMVRYIDYSTDVIDNFTNVLLPIMHKRTSFRHEQELRAVALTSVRRGHRRCWTFQEFPESGLDIHVDLNQLLDAVYVAPGAPDWFVKSVRWVVQKYGLTIPVTQSSLDDEPLW